MAWRFRKSIKIAPGLRWNISSSGMGLNIGPRGASISIGSKGTYLNSSIGALGLYNRQRIAGSGRQGTPRSPGTNLPSPLVEGRCLISPDGELRFVDEAGAPLPEFLSNAMKKNGRAAIRDGLQQRVDQINSELEAVERVHMDTPDPRLAPSFSLVPFTEPAPAPPEPTKLGAWASLFQSRRDEHEHRERLAMQSFESEHRAWRQRKDQHALQQARRKRFLEREILTDLVAMEAYFEERIAALNWPRETRVDYALDENGASMQLDIDLPEIEMLPSRTATLPARGLEIRFKEVTPTRLARLYAAHVHGVVFRAVGEAFSSLPRLATVVASGYSQRANPATGQVENDYLLSVRIQRASWERIEFGNLEAVDPIAVLEAHDLVRKPARGGRLAAIEPIEG